MANLVANPVPLMVVPFTNPSGAVVFRVKGTFRGVRIRRNFPTEAKAQAFISKHIQSPSPAALRVVLTTLPEPVVRRVEAALVRLPPGTDIVDVVDFFAAHYRPVQPIPMLTPPGVPGQPAKPGAVDRFAVWLKMQRQCEDVTITNRKTVLEAFSRFTAGVDGREVGPADRSDRITVELAKAWIYSPDVEVRTQRDRFDLLNWFGEFLVAHKLAATNPVAEFAQNRPVVKVKVPGVLSFDETWRLLQCALTDAEGPDMLPFFALCVLSGVRPDEVPRLGTDCVDADGKPDAWGDIYLEDEHPVIEVNKAKGGRSRRQVAVSEPLRRIMLWCKNRGLRPNFFSKRKFDRIRRRAGILERWEKDLLRHTYASHEYARTRDIKQLASDMGNSERVLFQSYIRPVPRLDAIRLVGLILHYSAPREKSAMGTGKKFRKSSPAGETTSTACQSNEATGEPSNRSLISC